MIVAHGEMIHTFGGFGWRRETIFAVLGRGHDGRRGGGSGSLSCGCHTLGW